MMSALESFKKWSAGYRGECAKERYRCFGSFFTETVRFDLNYFFDFCDWWNFVLCHRVIIYCLAHSVKVKRILDSDWYSLYSKS